MDPAARLLLGTALCVVVGWAPFACSAARQVTPETRDAAVKFALDEARRQCEVNPPNDARLQTACLALWETDRVLVVVTPKDVGNQAGSPSSPVVEQSSGSNITDAGSKAVELGCVLHEAKEPGEPGGGK